MGNSLTEKIEELLEPAVSSILARASLEVTCKSAGIKIDEISREDLPVIAKKLKDGLSLLFGADVAKDVATKVKNL